MSMTTIKVFGWPFTKNQKNHSWSQQIRVRLWHAWYWLNDYFMRIICLFLKPFLYGYKPSKETFALDKMRKILVVSRDEIGDVAILTAFLRELKSNTPEAQITLLVKPPASQLLEYCPYISQVHTLVANHPKTFGQWFAQIKKLLPQLWNSKFDLAILPRWDVDIDHGTLLLYLSGATWRIGYTENTTKQKQKLNTGYDRFLTHVIHDFSIQHEAQRALNLIHFMKGQVSNEHLEVWLSQEDENFVESVLKAHRVDASSLLVAINPGARELKRVWPLENYIEVARWLQQNYQVYIIIVGGAAEEQLGEKFQSVVEDESVINLAGKTTLRQLCAVLKYCHLYIGNDTGPMHLAAAVNTSVVEISCHARNSPTFHANSPVRFAPWKVEYTVLQPATTLSPCTTGCDASIAHCITQISANEAKIAIANHLGPSFVLSASNES